MVAEASLHRLTDWRVIQYSVTNIAHLVRRVSQGELRQSPTTTGIKDIQCDTKEKRMLEGWKAEHERIMDV